MGHKLSGEGIQATQSKIDSVLNFRAPRTSEEVRSLLGLVNFVGRFIPDLSTITESLRKLTRKTNTFEWGAEQEKSFQKIKVRLTEKRSLAYFDPEGKSQVIADASPVALGAVLIQSTKDGPRVISYASKSLSDVETRYSQTEKEALALVWACEHFHIYLYGKNQFDLITDHKPLEIIFSPKGKPCARVERWVLRMQGYNFRVVYREGKSNIADPLSRLPQNLQSSETLKKDGETCLMLLTQICKPNAMKLEEIIKATKEDAQLCSLNKSLETGKWEDQTKPFHPFKDEFSHVQGIILRGERIIVPLVLRIQILKLAHEGHPGISSMKQRLRSKVWWPGIDKETEKWVKSCHGCQIVSSGKPPEPMNRTELPNGAWEDLAIDYLGPLPSGHYLLVTIDYYRRFYEVDIMKQITAEKTIERLKIIFARFGLPQTLRMDNGPQFKSNEFKNYCETHNIKIKYTTPLWPQANGEVERQNRSLLKRLRIAQESRVRRKLERCIVRLFNTLQSNSTHNDRSKSWRINVQTEN